jgi:hypothetical protein
MALNRGTLRATFVYFVETFAMLGTLGGAGLGAYNAMEGGGLDVLIGAASFALFGFVGGSAVGAALGLITVILGAIFGRR